MTTDSTPLDSSPSEELKQRVIEALQTVYDPEIPVNIYEIGLIYGIDIDPSNAVSIQMTLTSPALSGCRDAAGRGGIQGRRGRRRVLRPGRPGLGPALDSRQDVGSRQAATGDALTLANAASAWCPGRQPRECPPLRPTPKKFHHRSHLRL